MIRDILHGAVTSDTRWYIQGRDLDANPVISFEQIRARSDFDIVPVDFPLNDWFLGTSLIRMERLAG